MLLERDKFFSEILKKTKKKQKRHDLESVRHCYQQFIYQRLEASQQMLLCTYTYTYTIPNFLASSCNVVTSLGRSNRKATQGCLDTLSSDLSK